MIAKPTKHVAKSNNTNYNELVGSLRRKNKDGY
jgi:hypothetical protein